LANIKSQEKRNRQNEKKRVKNSKVKNSIRTAVKKVQKTIDASKKENPAAVTQSLNLCIKTIDKAASGGTIHKRTAARKKSRLAKRVNAALKQA
jgi:small subunit ribosomal protein S20